MSTPILTTKLNIPPPQPKVVLRPRLIERLNEALHRILTLISAPAGFGKTTLLSEWIAGCEKPAAWLSLDEGDDDRTRFLAYLVAALQTIAPSIGEGVLGVLQSPQPPPTESILTALLNETEGGGPGPGVSPVLRAKRRSRPFLLCGLKRITVKDHSFGCKPLRREFWSSWCRPCRPPGLRLGDEGGVGRVDRDLPKASSRLHGRGRVTELAHQRR
jgi:hypothetical protein